MILVPATQRRTHIREEVRDSERSRIRHNMTRDKVIELLMANPADASVDVEIKIGFGLFAPASIRYDSTIERIVVELCDEDLIQPRTYESAIASLNEVAQ